MDSKGNPLPSSAYLEGHVPHPAKFKVRANPFHLYPNFSRLLQQPKKTPAKKLVWAYEFRFRHEKRMNNKAQPKPDHKLFFIFFSNTLPVVGKQEQRRCILTYLSSVVFICRSRFGVVAQLVRAPACHAGGRGFESRLSRHRNLSSGCVNERPEPTFNIPLMAKKSHRFGFGHPFQADSIFCLARFSRLTSFIQWKS